MLGGLFQRLYGMKQNDLRRVFAAARPTDLRLV
jgi:hypothetical protein